MSPLFMDTSYDEHNSPGSLSVEDNCSTSDISENKGEGQSGQRGSKRQEKNRDAARKSRRKQTERADELHEELQSLEHANSALHKEIAALKKELQLYTTALERHEPFCCLGDSIPSSCLSVTPTAECQTGSHPLGAPPPPPLPPPPPQAPSSTHAAPPPVSTSYTSGLGPQSIDCVRSTHVSTSASSAGLSAGPFTSSSSVTVPYSGSFSSVPAPHSLFSDDPPSLITSREANAMPVCTSLVSNLEPAASRTEAAQTPSRQGAIHEASSASAEAPFSTFQTPLFNVAPPYSRLAAQNTGLVGQGCSTDVPLLHPVHHRGNSHSSNSLLTLHDHPSLQPLSVPPQANLEPSLATVFASKPSGHAIPSPTSLLSLLTIPSPLNVPQTTSSSFDGPLVQPPPSVAPSGDLSKDLCLSELLEFNDWILQ